MVSHAWPAGHQRGHKKKEWIGNFKNPGRCWRKRHRKVLDHDYPSWASGRAIPLGSTISHTTMATSWYGTSHGTAAFITAAIGHWWLVVGRHRYPGDRRMLMEMDGGGANDPRTWLWKVALQGLADEAGLIIVVTHYPSGASKWNPIEHRMFSVISSNWAGEPLVSYETIAEVHPHGLDRARDFIVVHAWIEGTTNAGEGGHRGQGADATQAELGAAQMELHDLASHRRSKTNNLGSYCVSKGQLASITLSSCVTDTCGGISPAPATSYKCLL